MMDRSPSPWQRHAGFTLIELLVAMTAGLFVAIGAFALAKQGSRFFQQEARVANAQFAATLGFDRLRADIARTGFLSTPNIQRDKFRCGSVIGLPAGGMGSLSALRLNRNFPAAAQDSNNGLAPDSLVLSGSYGSAETFPVRTVVFENSRYEVYLQANTGAVARSGNGAADGGSIAQIFRAGRMLRILDGAGYSEFGWIDAYTVKAGGEMVVSLKQNPAITFRRDGGYCGVEGLGVGMQANVVNIVRYELRNLRQADLPRFRPLYDTVSSGPGDQQRLELIRVELDAQGNEIDDTLELVAEYAVDLKFGLTVVSGFRTPSDPDITSFPVGDSRIYDYSFDVAANTAAGPERIRAVRARLVVRSREADRTDNVAAPTPGNIFRYAVPGDAGFARARTLTADIQLPNLTGVNW